MNLTVALIIVAFATILGFGIGVCYGKKAMLKACIEGVAKNLSELEVDEESCVHYIRGKDYGANEDLEFVYIRVK